MRTGKAHPAPRPFRFIAPMPSFSRGSAVWRTELKRIEDAGFSTVAISDHVARGWQMDVFTTLAAAAMVTTRLRLLTLVLGNDYRHPALVHRAAATIDVLSEGRLELGIGAGWLAEDYRHLGLNFERAGVRIDRLEESVRLIRELFAGADVTFDGEHYRVDGLPGLPLPAQLPAPPLLVGGGGPRMLRLAARYADIVGVHLALPSGRVDAESVRDLSRDRVRDKVDLIRVAAQAAGRRPEDLELQFSAYHVAIDGGRRARSSFSDLLAADPVLASSPAVVVGSVDRCVDLLQQYREEFGFSYWSLGGDLDAVGPVVSELAGR